MDAYSRVSTNQQDFLSLLADCHEDSFGESFGIAYQDPEMGKLTVNVGQVSYTEEAGGLISCDCRYQKGLNSLGFRHWWHQNWENVSKWLDMRS